ncbi:MAG: toprim domain-containing protein, partial [Candidatus Paceibacterota bacterium]
RLSGNIVLAFDADKAGFNAANRASKIALSFGMDVKVASMPDGVDPADLISKQGVDAWRETIRNSKHIIEFLLEKVLKNYSSDMRKAGREIKEKILPYVDAVDSAIEQAHFIKKISDLSQISENALKDDLKKVTHELKYEKQEIKEAKHAEVETFKKDYIERRLLGIILWQKNLKEEIINVQDILKEISEILNIKEEEVLEKTKDSKEDLIFEAEVFYGDDVDLQKDVRELLNNLREEYLKEELAKKMKELQIYEEKKDYNKSEEILKEINDLNQKIHNIKSGRLNK